MRQEIQDLLAKKDFSEGLLKLDDPSKVKDYFTTKGNLKDVTDEEIKELGSSLENLMQKISELPEDKLEKIGGGGPDPNFYDQFAAEDIDVPTFEESEKRYEVYKNHMSMGTGAKAGIGAASLAVLATTGAGIYKLGKKKGWWKGFSKK